MTSSVALAGVTVPAGEWLGRGFGEGGPEIANAANGEGSFGRIVFENPDGTLDVRGWMDVAIEESDCAAAPRLQTGYVWDRDYSRGKYTSGAGCEIDTQLLDQNAVLSARLITNPDGDRPAETHLKRIDWLLGSSYLSGLITDLGLVNRSSAKNMGKADYRGQYPADVLMDISAPIARIFFAYWDQDARQVALFFDVPTATTLMSSLSISNVAADVDNLTVFAPWQDAKLTRSPSEVYAKARVKYAKGVVIQNLASTVTEFFTDNGIGYRGIEIDNTRIGSEDSARDLGDNILARDSAEKDTITCTLELPSTVVGLIDAGMQVPARFSHFPGYTGALGSKLIRVEKKSVVLRERNGKLYEVTLTLSSHGFSGGGGGGAPGPGDFPHPPAGSPSVVDENDNKQGVNDGNLHVAPSAGDNLIVWCISRTATGPITSSGWTTEVDVHTTDALFTPLTRYGTLFSRVSDGSEGINPFLIPAGDSIVIWNFGPDVTIGYGSPVNDQSTGILNCGTVTPTGPALVFGCVIESTDDSDTFATTPDAGVTEIADFENNSGNMPWIWAGSKVTTAGGATAVTGTVVCSNPVREFWGACSFYVESTAAANPPTPTQDNGDWEVVTMTTSGGVSIGTTRNPGLEGSLLVKVDGLIISPASYAWTDASCGNFALTWQIDPDEVVSVKYKAA